MHMHPTNEVAPPSRVRGRGRPKSLDGGSKVHIAISEVLTERLLQLQPYTRASSLTELVKDALTLYAAAVELHKDGGGVYFKRKDQELERVALFL